MKVFSYPASMCCGSCGYQMIQVGAIDPETRDVAINCTSYKCERRGVLLKLPATVLNLDPIEEKAEA